MVQGVFGFFEMFCSGNSFVFPCPECTFDSEIRLGMVVNICVLRNSSFAYQRILALNMHFLAALKGQLKIFIHRSSAPVAVHDILR